MKTGTKFSRTVIKQSKTQSNGRVNPPKPQIQYKPAWDPEYWVCSQTPRFSYSVPETCVGAVSPPRVRARRRVGTRVGMHAGWVPGGYTGWVIPGSQQQPTDTLKEVPTSEAGPGSPC